MFQMTEVSPETTHPVRLGNEHFRGLLGEMYQQYKGGCLSDFTIETKNDEIHCHRLILASTFPYFTSYFRTNALLGNDCTRSQLFFLDTKSVRKLVEFAYTGVINFGVDNIESLVEAAGYLQCDYVLTECDKYLAGFVNRNNNCMRYYVLARKFNLPQTSKIAYRQVLTFFADLIHTDSFKNMHPDDLKSFLKDDMLNIESEDLAVEALLVWCSHEPCERRQITQELLSHVRFNYCSISFLKSVTTDPKFNLICTPRFRHCVSNALRHQSEKSRAHHLKKPKRSSERIKQQPRFSYSANKLLLIGGKANKKRNEDGNLRSCSVWRRTEHEWCEFSKLPEHYDQCFQWEVTAAGDRFFVTGGYKLNTETGYSEGCADVWMWWEGKWHCCPRLLQGRWMHGAVYAMNTLFVFGGKSRQKGNCDKLLKINECLSMESLEKNLRYSSATDRQENIGQDVDANTASQNEQKGWQKITSMKNNFYCPHLNVIGENIYLVGMLNYSFNSIGQVYEYNIRSRRFKQLPTNIPAKDHRYTTLTVGEKIYLMGGRDDPVNLCYTPATNTWCQLSPPLSSTCSISPAVHVDQAIVVARREKEKDEHMTVDEYDPEKEEWRKNSLKIPEEFTARQLTLINCEINV